MSSLRDDLALVRERDFALLLAARTISVLGSGFAPVALAFGVLHLPGGNARMLSIVLACESIPMIVLLLLGGVVADRLPRSRLVMAADLLSCLAFGGNGLLLAVGYTPLPLLCLVAAASGVGMSVLWPALTGLVPEVVPPEKLQAGNALLAMMVNISRILGVVAAGFVVALAGAQWALGFSALLFAVAAVLVGRLPLWDRAPDRPAIGVRDVLRDLRDGWREFSSRQWLWVVVAQFSILVLCFSAAHGVFGPVVAEAERGGARAWSWILAGESAGMLVGVAIAMRVKPRRPILAAVLITVPTIPLPWLLLGTRAPLALVIAASFLMGVAFDFFGVLWNTTMQREVAPEALSRVSSYDAMGSLMFGPIGLLLAGPATVWFGVHRALIGCGALLFVVAAAGLASPGVRGLRWRDVPVSGDVPAVPLMPEQLS